MNGFTTPAGGRFRTSMPAAGDAALSTDRGVEGWLLVLCLMLTVVAPLAAVALSLNKYLAAAPLFAGSPGLLLATWAAIAMRVGAVAFGIHAGLRLWAIRPGAVGAAKLALLLGLGASAVATVVHISAVTGAHGRLLHEVTVGMIPSLAFFIAWFAYLNKSTRVQATYMDEPSRRAR